MFKRVVVAIVSLSLALLPAALAADAPPVSGLPPFVGCHGEVAATQDANGHLSVQYDPARLYQKFTYYVRSYGGSHVAKIEVVELRHEKLPEPAVRSGLRDPDSIKRFYRIEYGVQIKTKGDDGSDVDSYVQIMSGPDGVLLEILTLLPIKNAPAVQGDDPVKETKL